MISRTLNLTLIAFFWFGASSVCAQQPATPTVYISDVAVSTSATTDEQKIATAVKLLLELRLNSIKSVEVINHQPQCESRNVSQSQPSRSEEVPAPVTFTEQPGLTYQVNGSLKTLTSATVSSSGVVELILEYDLVKYVRCKQVPVIHRSEPISLKTAFVAIVQMGDVLEVAIKDDSAPRKIVVDLVDVTGASDVGRLKQQLTNAVLVKLADQADFQVRSFTEKPASGGASDYVVTGEVISRNQRGAKFVVQNVKRNKSSNFFVPGPVGQANADEKALADFYDKSAAMVLSYIRSEGYASEVSDAEASAILNRAMGLLCKGPNTPADCVAQPALVIPDLTRLKDSNKVNPEILSLLGDAYSQLTDYRRAFESYSEAWEKSLNNSSVEVSVSYLTKAAEASYKGQEYAQAAELYDRLIQSLKNAPSIPLNLYLQATRSHRFANEPLKALDRALEGLSKYPNAEEWDEEVKTILQSIYGQHLNSAYESLVKYKNIPKVASWLSEVRERLAEDLAEGAIELVIEERKFEEAERKLRLIESLSIESLTKDGQLAYRIARAVWIRDAKNDYAGAILLLEPLLADESEIGMAGQFLLADTLYRKGRAAKDESRNDYYTRASAISMRVAEKFSDTLVLKLLMKSNHELGKDQESRQILEKMIARGGSEYNVNEARVSLVVLCTDYLNDPNCVENNIREIGANRLQWDRDLSLRLATIHLTRRQYAEVDTLLSARDFDPKREYLEVELFLKVWLELAADRPVNGAQAFFNAWRAHLEPLRRTGFRSDWIFTTAQRGIESDPSLTSAKKELLKRMILAMNDNEQPLPQAAELTGATPRSNRQ